VPTRTEVTGFFFTEINSNETELRADTTPHSRARHMHASLASARVSIGSRGRSRVCRPADARGASNPRRAASFASGRASIDVRCQLDVDATRRACSVAAALILAVSTAFDASAFVPIKGCGDPGSPYDTGVVLEQSAGGESDDGRKLANCTKLYQPARDAERRAVAAAKQGKGGGADETRGGDAKSTPAASYDSSAIEPS